MDYWLLSNLVCPRHQQRLSQGAHALLCPQQCRYPLVDGVPVMLLDDVRQTMEVVESSVHSDRHAGSKDDLYVETLSLSRQEREGILRLASEGGAGVDPVVSYLVAATNGIAYKDQIGKLKEYPIPELRLPAGGGRVFLDMGCSWGRWSVAAARLGYKVVGIDPQLGAVMAARRVATQLGIEATFIVADARYLPFRSEVFDDVFSYSVIQHLSRDDAAKAVDEVGRVLRPGGRSLIQMPTKSGIRCIYNQARRRFREGSGFEVRYWSIASLHKLFSTSIGPSATSVDCYFGIGLQYSDLRFMSPVLKAVVLLSELLRNASRLFRPLVWIADSVYVSSSKR